MITEIITKIAVKILDTAGYAGAGFLMALESMIAPVPSEAVMPFVGFLVADGKWNLGWAIAVDQSRLARRVLASYWMGYYGGKPFVLKVGKYLLLNRRDLEFTERFFIDGKGWTVFLRPICAGDPPFRLHSRRHGTDATAARFMCVTHRRHPLEQLSPLLRHESARALDHRPEILTPGGYRHRAGPGYRWSLVCSLPLAPAIRGPERGGRFD